MALTSMVGSPSHTASHHSIWFSFCRLITRRFPSSTVQNESSQMMAFVNGAFTTHFLASFLNPTFRFFLVITTFKSRPRVLSGKGTLTVTSDRVWVHTYFPSTVPPFPRGGFASFVSPSPSVVSFCCSFSTGSVFFAGGISSFGFVGFSCTFVGEMSKPPSAPASSTSGSSFFDIFFGVFFFLDAFACSALYKSACLFRTAWTLAMAASTPLSPLPGGPAKKSVFRRRNENTVSNSGSIPLVVWATFKYNPSKRSSSDIVAGRRI
mmetsp:Transcript_17765/g.41147  ORF Transcript_17765/g.41147 Transcript_17765/m.41147 type:complete len:265 (-) Transcript_17765:1-795(-)